MIRCNVNYTLAIARVKLRIAPTVWINSRPGLTIHCPLSLGHDPAYDIGRRTWKIGLYYRRWFGRFRNGRCS